MFMFNTIQSTLIRLFVFNIFPLICAHLLLFVSILSLYLPHILIILVLFIILLIFIITPKSKLIL